MKQKTLSFFLSIVTLGFLSLFPFSSSALATTIVIDPGHSGCNPPSICLDKSQGFLDQDSNNGPENQEVWDVATELKGKLQAAGYTVLLTKNGPYDNATFWQRAQKANNANADLAISIHDDHGEPSSWAQVYEQTTDSYRLMLNGKPLYFKDPKIAGLSDEYAHVFEKERTAAEGHAVPIVVNTSFGGRGLAPGNIPWVQLLSKVPWVYNEYGAASSIDKEAYVTGLYNSIIHSVAPINSGAGSGNATTTSNCVITKVGNPQGQPQLPPQCTSASGNESAIVQNVIALAKAHLKTGTYFWGTPSRDWASENPSGHAPTEFDCSGFVGWAWYWGSGGKISMLGQTQSDFNFGSNSSFAKLNPPPKYHSYATSDESLLQPGDAVYFGSSTSHIVHTGLFVGQDACGANDCFLQYYSNGLPGNEESVARVSSPGFKFVGFIRMNVQ